MTDDPTRFDGVYRDHRTANELPAATPWDIGGPQPVVERLVALGAIRGNVLDPGTGPGHHAIHFASRGYPATGVDASPAAIERARRNARRAGVSVRFETADATVLEGFDGHFDTVVDCAFYHTLGQERLRDSYLEALRRTTRAGARLYLFAFAPHNVNGLRVPPAMSEEHFLSQFPPAGWQITYLGPTTLEINVSLDAFQEMAERNAGLVDGLDEMMERLRIIEPLLVGGRALVPYWEVHATRTD